MKMFYEYSCSLPTFKWKGVIPPTL